MDDDHATAFQTAPGQGDGIAEELSYRLEQQRLTAEFGRYAIRTRGISDLLQEATEVCARGLNSNFCKVLEFLPDEGEFIVRAGIGWKPGVVGHARVGADSASPAGYAFQTGEPVISNHLGGETRFRTPALLAEHGIRRAINVLIQGDEGRYGVLEVDSPTEGRFTEADTTFLQALAALLGAAIERNQADDALRISQAELQDAIAHQKVLTLEISHRVKNSLSIVASLLGMQARVTSSAILKQGLDDARGRVMTIAQFHDRLWRADEVHTIDLAKFMDELCSQICRSAGPGQTLKSVFTPVMVATDQAVPLALIANELITNAFKYAYPSGKGEVKVAIDHTRAGYIRLTVSDTGQGLPADFDRDSGQSLGMKLITSFGHQLGGIWEWERTNPGTRFMMEFPIQKSARPSD